MKKYLLIISVICFVTSSFAQNKNEVKDVNEIDFDKSKFLKELSDNACKCIDSISTFNVTSDTINSKIHRCINEQVGAYQLGLKLASLKNLDEIANDANGKKEVTIEFNSNENSKEYKEYYYEIERYLIDNCPAIKTKLTSEDKLREKSISNNDESLRYYSLALEEDKKENYAKAIEYYKKAVAVDHDFAFAYDNMGLCYRRLNKFDEAIVAYEKSLKIDPNGMMPLQNIAIAYQYKKEYKKSVNAYERLAKIDSKNPEVYYGIGQIYTQFLFNYEKALENLCLAYNIYVEQKSPYRTDAEKLIQTVYSEMKKQGKEEKFNQILKSHNIKSN